MSQNPFGDLFKKDPDREVWKVLEDLYREADYLAKSIADLESYLHEIFARNTR